MTMLTKNIKVSNQSNSCFFPKQIEAIFIYFLLEYFLNIADWLFLDEFWRDRQSILEHYLIYS
jgi:hypothetical protein